MAAASAFVADCSDLLAGYVLEHHIGFLLRRAHQRHATLFNEMIGDADLTPTQFAAMIRIVQAGRVTQNLLGRQTAMDPATIQGVVRRLIERGYVDRDVDPMDRRSVVLLPTRAAHESMEHAVVAVRAIASRMLEPLEPAERVELKRLLNKLY